MPVSYSGYAGSNPVSDFCILIFGVMVEKCIFLFLIIKAFKGTPVAFSESIHMEFEELKGVRNEHE